MVKNIANFTFKSPLSRNLESFYEVDSGKEWIESLDVNLDVLGFGDCVFDAKTKEFREGTLLDMITLSMGHKRKDVEKCDGSIREKIIEMFETIHDKKEVFTFVMQVLATGISGDRVKDRFHIWTGIGSNGKSMTKTTLKSAYGGYYNEVNSGLFATRSIGSSSSATPNLALIHGKRVVYNQSASRRINFALPSLSNVRVTTQYPLANCIRIACRLFAKLSLSSFVTRSGERR
jgi:hypothetical protein